MTGMRLYALIKHHVVYNIIETDEPFWLEGIDITDIEPRPGLGWTYAADADTFSPPPPERRRVTALAFDLRFTMDEHIAIDLASLDNPAAPMEQRVQAAALRVSKERAKKATFIDLDDPVTRDGVQFMEQAGLLAQGVRWIFWMRRLPRVSARGPGKTAPLTIGGLYNIIDTCSKSAPPPCLMPGLMRCATGRRKHEFRRGCAGCRWAIRATAAI